MTVVADTPSRALTIVLVDDDQLVLTNTSAMLEDSGHTVLEASSGGQALDLIRRAPHVDVVITDQAMPQMTGLQLAAAVKVEWPALPVLLVSGYAELPQEDRARLPTPAKPYSFQDLRAAVATVIAASGAGDEALSSTYRS